MKAFMQVAEVWKPRGEKMALYSGAYGHHTEFGQVSESTQFALGEGLPGSVWSSQKPQVWDSLEEGNFVRLPAARRAGLEAGVGIPIAAGGRAETNAVVVLLCGSRAQTGGCIERWDVHPETGDLLHAGGYYGNLEKFAAMSPRMRFPRGHGLPGVTLERGIPTIEADTRHSGSFVRAEVARESGIEAGVGIPIYRGGKIEHVVVLLSSASTPLARAFEVWVPSHSDTLKLDQSFYTEGLEAFAEQSKSTTAKVGKGLAGRAFRTELPHVLNGLSSPPFVRHQAAEQAGLTVGIAIPVSNGASVVAVVLLLS